jgi:hypothetical protein
MREFVNAVRTSKLQTGSSTFLCLLERGTDVCHAQSKRRLLPESVPTLMPLRKCKPRRPALWLPSICRNRMAGGV